MASVVEYDGGLKRIEFSLTPRGRRWALRLGRVSTKTAETWRSRIETIISDNLAKRPHDPELSKWLGELDEKMLARLRAVGLAEGVGLAQATVGEFLKREQTTMTGKPATRTFYGHTRRNLREYFGEGRLLQSIRHEDADGWRAWLVEHEKLSAATVARRVIAARTIWRKAARWKLVSENPFAGVKGGHQENDSRKRFIRREIIDKLIAQAPDTEWKLIIALARYGGLRCPSELFALKWGDVDWDSGRFIVHSIKTEHHEGKATRVVPLFTELRPHMMAAFEEAEPGTEHVIARHRLSSMNLRQQFERIIERAGLVPWPRLFQNLRASRETELFRQYDLTTVCRWIGNSPAVAARHYAMSVDLNADFERAADCGPAPKAQQKAQQSATTSERQPATTGAEEPRFQPENVDLVMAEQTTTAGDKGGKWAIQDSNL